VLPDAYAAVDAVYRSDWGRIVASLIKIFGDFDLAEESAQEAFAAAANQWLSDGIPNSPRAWIIQSARHKAIDRIRRERRFSEELQAYAFEMNRDVAETNEEKNDDIPDERLRLIFPTANSGMVPGKVTRAI
jgi:RNA polymerase sigma-70 factor (ECF subfamily)